MIYSLRFKKSAQREWNNLTPSLKEIFQKKIQEILLNPHNPKNKLRGMPNCYKIKIMRPPYRLVYKVEDQCLTIEVIAVGKRDKSKVYENALDRGI